MLMLPFEAALRAAAMAPSASEVRFVLSVNQNTLDWSVVPKLPYRLVEHAAKATARKSTYE